MLRRLLGPTLLVLSVATIVYFIVREDLVTLLLGIDGRTLVWLLLASIASLVLRGQQLANVSEPFGVRFARGEPTGLSAMHTLANYLPARAGLVIRGAYLRRFHDLAVADYTAMTALWLVGSLLSAVVLGFVLAAVGVADVRRGPALLVFASCGAALVLGYLALELVVGASSREQRWAHWLRRVQAGLRLWRAPGRWRISFVVCSFALLLAQGVRYWIALRALGDTSGLGAALIIQALMAVSILISLTPGNIGIREGIAALAATLTGVDLEIALLAAIIDRAAADAVSVGGFALLGRPLLARYRASAPSEP